MSVSLQRYAELLKRLLVVRGGEGVRDLSPELVAAIILENDRFEYLCPQGARPWMGQIVIAAAAGFYGQALIVPNDKNTLTVIQGIGVSAAAYVSLVKATGFSAITNFGMRDTRCVGLPSTVFLARNNSNAQLTTTNLAWPLAASGSITFPLCSTGKGPTFILVETQVVNSAITITAFGYERPIEDTEQSGSVV